MAATSTTVIFHDGDDDDDCNDDAYDGDDADDDGGGGDDDDDDDVGDGHGDIYSKHDSGEQNQFGNRRGHSHYVGHLVMTVATGSTSPRHHHCCLQ